MIGCYPDVGSALLDHRQNRAEHAAHGADILAVRIHYGRHRKEMAEQLVGAVDQMNLHRSGRYHVAALVAGYVAGVDCSASCDPFFGLYQRKPWFRTRKPAVKTKAMGRSPKVR